MSNRRLVFVAVLVLGCVAYLPYIFGGGSFMIDDLMMIVQSHFDKSVWKTFVFWNTLGGGGMRPLGSTFFALTPPLFGTNPIPYILLNTACWIAAIALVSRVVKDYCGESAALWFTVLGIIPTIASSTIFEPIVMIIGSSSTLFWALSLWNLQEYLKGKKTLNLILTYLLVIIGLLIYEVSAPLLLITALLPLLPTLANHRWSESLVRREALRYGAPVALVIIGLALFQKLIVPLYGVSLSRLSARPLGDMARSFGRWLFSVVIDTPVMLVSSLTHYGAGLFVRWDWWLLVLAVVAFVVILRKAVPELATTNKSQRERQLFLAMIVLTLLGCSALAVFSGFNMRVEGIENRFLGSTWILLSILLAAAFARLQHGFGVIVPALIVVMTYFSFMIQAQNYIANRRLQEAVINDSFTKLQAEQIQPGAFIIGNVPIYANNNFNNEVVFAYRHDFGGQLKMRFDSKTLIDEGQVVNVNREAPTNDTTRFFLSRDRDTVMTGNLTGLMKRPLNGNVWWYEYDQYTQASRLVRLRDSLHFDSIWTANRQGSVNIAVLPVTERFRNNIKTMFGKKK
ncbi:MAG: hypothetical protein H9535_09900 [Ignavibacteria bacterium]|nr:hypothetical protein [Ignavibacteria bacterium]